MLYFLSVVTFSQRHGYRPDKKEIQLEGMDIDLKNSLWNMIDFAYLHDIRKTESSMTPMDQERMFLSLWVYLFKKPFSEIQNLPLGMKIRNLKLIFDASSWYDTYDIVEFFAKHSQNKKRNEFTETCNNVLEHEFSGYRFIGDTLSKITSKEEMKEVKEAIESGINSVHEHLKTSMSMLSDKKFPDYRNSIKESISAVESVCKLITNNPNTTMGSALEEIEQKKIIELHPDMKIAFKKFYSYTNDASGIRHSLMDIKTGVDFDDAKFMLVSCSAFTNYLISKANKSKIKLI